LPTLPPTPTPKKIKNPTKKAVIEEPRVIVKEIVKVVEKEPEQEPRRLVRVINAKEKKVYEALKEMYTSYYKEDEKGKIKTYPTNGEVSNKARLEEKQVQQILK
jgi:hypothetical protein